MVLATLVCSTSPGPIVRKLHMVEPPTTRSRPSVGDQRLDVADPVLQRQGDAIGTQAAGGQPLPPPAVPLASTATSASSWPARRVVGQRGGQAQLHRLRHAERAQAIAR